MSNSINAEFPLQKGFLTNNNLKHSATSSSEDLIQSKEVL